MTARPNLLALLLLALFLLTPAAVAQPAGSPAPSIAGLQPVRQLEGITEYQLPNGLRVLLAPDDSKPTATVNLTYLVGSRHEGRGETGAAHLLEHMLFKSSATIADPKLEMTRRGARWNGTTWLDRTNYFATFASDAETLEWMIGWLAESMSQARLDQAEFNTELTVVRNELERAENEPARVLNKRMTSAAYEWHGYRHNVLGARSDVERIPLARLAAFYRRHYRPDNAVLVIGGRFDAPAALARVTATFGPIARPVEPLPPEYTVEPPQDGERHVTLRRVGGNAHVAVLYHAMPGSARDFAALRVLTQLLGMEGGLLHQALVQRGIGVTQAAFAYSTRDPGHLIASVGLAEGADEAAAAQALAALVRTVESARPSESQVAMARGMVLKSINDALRDPQQLSLGLSESIALGDWRLWFAMRDWIEAVTAADVQRVAATWLLPSNRTSGSYLPTTTLPPRAPLAPPVDVALLLSDYRGKATAAAAVQDFALTPANIDAHTVLRRLTIGGAPGLRLALLPRPMKEDRVTGTLRLLWGSADSLNGQQALAGLAGPMLLRGTTSRPAERITADLLAMDARLTFSSGASGLTANFELPARHLPAFNTLLAQILREPAFDAAEFERLQKSQLAGLLTTRADTAALAANALQRVFAAPAQDDVARAAGRYPPGDPRSARSFDDVEAQLRTADAAQLRAFWQRFAGAGTGELALVGPIDAEAVTTQWQQALADWRAPEPRRPWIYAYPSDLAGLPPLPPQRIADKANASYSARIPLSMNIESPDYPALFAGVQLLGGRAGTALWRRLREQEGLSYGVSASLFAPAGSERFPGGEAAAINITASFAPQNRERLQAAVRDELARRAEGGFSAIEVGFARRAIVSARAEALAQPANLAGTLATHLRHGHDMRHYARFTEAYETLDTDAVNAALRKYLRPERLVEVTAGSFP